MIIRDARFDDTDGIINLLYQVNQVHADGRNDLFKSGGIKYTAEDLKDKIGKKDAPIYVAVEDDKILGYVFCQIEDTKETTSVKPHRTLYIDDLCVDSVSRGKHVGSALYEYTKEKAKELGVYHITLHVWECNPEARKFYDSLGLCPMYTAMEEILQTGDSV